MPEQALAGLKVVEWGDFMSAAYCTKLMADLGAEVIKVEDPARGDEARHHGPFPDDEPHPERSGLFLYLNANKRGVTLNLRTEEGRRLFRELLKDSDVMVENNPPELVAELGLDYPSLCRVNDRLIMTSITPYGQTGPYRDHKGYALNAAAVGGITIVVGEPGREPLAPPLSLGHYQSGAMGAVATMTALFARDLTGRGQHVDVSEAEVWATLHMGQMVHGFVFGNRRRMRAGHRTNGIYPYTILPCKDGYLCLVAIQGYQWKRFLDVIGNPEWASDPRFRDRREMSLKYADELDSLLAPWLQAHTKDEIFALCREQQIPFCPVRDIGEVVNEPHLAERGYFVELEHQETGKLKYPGAPYQFSETPWRAERPAPLLGEHNEEVLCGRLGLSRQKLAGLREEGVL